MSPGTENQLSCWSLQSRVWLMVHSRVRGCVSELSRVCAVCFISWHSEGIWTPAAHRSVTSRPVSDMCRFVIISISDLFTLWLQNRKKPTDLCVSFLLEREKQQLYRQRVWKQKNSASSESLIKKATAESEPCPTMLQQEVRHGFAWWIHWIGEFIPYVWSQMWIYTLANKDGLRPFGGQLGTLVLSNILCGPSL